MASIDENERQGDHRLRSLFASLPIATVVTAANERITAINRAAADLLSSQEHLIGQRLRDVLTFSTAAGEPIVEGQVHAATHVDRYGRRVDLEVRCTAIPGDNPEQATVHIIHDVSHYAELSRLREQLLYNVAHELRSPLAVLDNALEILNADYAELSADEFGQMVRGATRTAARLRRLMEDLLSAGSIQTGRFQIHRRPVPLTTILGDAMNAAEPLAHERLLHIVCPVPDEPLTVLADRTYAGRVLMNLLNNAIKYSPEGADIHVRAEQSGAMVRIAVQDHGPGIPAEQQFGLFERFYRVRARSEEPGIGLGLAIARGIVEAHGGIIGIESASGQGTTVWFTLPSVRPDQEGKDRT